MSRSFRHTPIMGITTCQSEKKDKKLWHKKFRQAIKNAVRREDEVMPHQDEHSDPWLMGKDGKKYFGWNDAIAWRKKARRK